MLDDATMSHILRNATSDQMLAVRMMLPYAEGMKEAAKYLFMVTSGASLFWVILRSGAGTPASKGFVPWVLTMLMAFIFITPILVTSSQLTYVTLAGENQPTVTNPDGTKRKIPAFNVLDDGKQYQIGFAPYYIMRVAMFMEEWVHYGLNAGLKAANVSKDGVSTNILDAIQHDTLSHMGDSQMRELLSDYQRYCAPAVIPNGKPGFTDLNDAPLRGFSSDAWRSVGLMGGASVLNPDRRLMDALRGVTPAIGRDGTPATVLSPNGSTTYQYETRDEWLARFKSPTGGTETGATGATGATHSVTVTNCNQYAQAAKAAWGAYRSALTDLYYPVLRDKNVPVYEGRGLPYRTRVIVQSKEVMASKLMAARIERDGKMSVQRNDTGFFGSLKEWWSDEVSGLDAAGLGVYKWWNALKVRYWIPIAVGSVSMFVGLFFVLLPLVAVATVFPGFSTLFTRSIQVLVALKITLLAALVFNEILTVVGSSIALYMNNAAAANMDEIYNIANTAYVMDIVRVLAILVGSTALAKYLILGDDSAVRRMNFDFYNNGVVAKMAAAGFAASRLMGIGGAMRGAGASTQVTPSVNTVSGNAILPPASAGTMRVFSTPPNAGSNTVGDVLNIQWSPRQAKRGAAPQSSGSTASSPPDGGSPTEANNAPPVFADATASPRNDANPFGRSQSGGGGNNKRGGNPTTAQSPSPPPTPTAAPSGDNPFGANRK